MSLLVGGEPRVQEGRTIRDGKAFVAEGFVSERFSRPGGRAGCWLQRWAGGSGAVALRLQGRDLSPGVQECLRCSAAPRWLAGRDCSRKKSLEAERARARPSWGWDAGNDGGERGVSLRRWVLQKHSPEWWGKRVRARGCAWSVAFGDIRLCWLLPGAESEGNYEETRHRVRKHMGRLSPAWVRWCCRTAQLHLRAPSRAPPFPPPRCCSVPSPQPLGGTGRGHGGGGEGMSLQQSLLAHHPHPMQPNVLPSPCKCCTVPESESLVC